MNLATICFLGNDSNLVLREYTEWFVNGFDIGLTNHAITYMHEQTILDNPVTVDVDRVHIVFEENSLSHVESTVSKLLSLNVFPKKAKYSFTCIKMGKKNIQLDASEFDNGLFKQLGKAFNGCAYWSICNDWNRNLLKVIQYRMLRQTIENEGLSFGRTYTINKVPNVDRKKRFSSIDTKEEIWHMTT